VVHEINRADVKEVRLTVLQILVTIEVDRRLPLDHANWQLMWHAIKGNV
jgi:hypothetical protein